MAKIRVAIVGVGNCASSLVQGVTYYRQANDNTVGLMHWDLGGYEPTDLEFAAAFDVDERKVGADLSDAIFAKPNCTAVFARPAASGIVVRMGVVLDGVAEHMASVPSDRSFRIAQAPQPTADEIVGALKEARVDVLVNFLPVGSEEAVKFYMQCALDAGVGVVNCMPVFIASDPEWEQRFKNARLPIVGDDIKAQFGATIVHRTLSNLMRQRGVRLDRTYQLNTGGNTDFLNMMDRGRLTSKKISKTEAVQAVLAERLADENIHVGPSDYVPWLNDNKLCFLRLEGALFGAVPMNIEVRLSVEDSPNSAGVVIDAVRCCKLALERGQSGALVGPSAFFCKHPPHQFTDDEAQRMTERFIHPASSARGPLKCLIVAAGQGTRFRDVAPSKPLAPIKGVPLIERVIVNAQAAGLTDFVVVTGYEGGRVENFLAGLAARRGVAVTCVRNPEFRLANGLSVVAAEAQLGEQFVLLMADHLFDPSILTDMIAGGGDPDGVVLAIDRRLKSPLIDPDDVTRVRTDGGGAIRAIGKGLTPYNAVDTGVFLASRALIDSIRADHESGGEGSISAGMQRLASAGLAHAFDIGDRFWLDIDDAVAHGEAERLSV
ncbi:MAG TPA: NTP transferase domain-containing protein [Caulobacteraceae bacterium]|nr:NTP transferase domain-containing protein [Caulobacteraceae bacterium]